MHDERRILVVDDDAGTRALVRSVLERGSFEVEEAETGPDAVAAGRRRRPDLVVLDVQLPGMSGYEIFRELRDEHGEDLPVVFLSGERTESLDRVAGLVLGAEDYLVKPFDPGELLVRLRRLLDRAPRAAAAPGPRYRLTTREQEVLSLVAEGLGPAEIARTLVISPKTAATHIQNVLGKLGVNNRSQAVAVAHREGLVPSAAARAPA